MTHPQALQVFPDTRQVWLHKNNKIKLPLLYQFVPGAGKWQLHSALSLNALYMYLNV
jgi:hypothetical protein